MSEKKVIVISERATEVIKVLKDLNTSTVNELKKYVKGVNSSIMRQLINNGLVESSDSVLKCACCGHSRKVLSYTITNKGMGY